MRCDGHPSPAPAGHLPFHRREHDKVRRSAWRIVCAGGYLAAGFHGTIGHSDVWNRLDAPNRYIFTIQDEGAAAQLGALQSFFTTLPFWRMQPFTGVTGDVVALADPGKTFVVYYPRGGATTLDLSAARGAMVARWFNPRTGEFSQAERLQEAKATARREFSAPDTRDWVLLLKPSED